MKFRVPGFGARVQGSGCRFQDFSWVWSLRFRVSGLGARVQVSEFGGWSIGFRVAGRGDTGWSMGMGYRWLLSPINLDLGLRVS